MKENRVFTKEDALKLLDTTIKEMQQSLIQKDDYDIMTCDLGAEINLMNDLYKKLCLVFNCKPYGTDLPGFIQDLQCRMRLPYLYSKENYAQSFMCHTFIPSLQTKKTISIASHKKIYLRGEM